MILKFIDFELNKFTLITKFNEFSDSLTVENLKLEQEYIKCTAFVCENLIKNEDLYKKRTGHYLKYKTIPKWHHYAWDMIR